MKETFGNSGGEGGGGVTKMEIPERWGSLNWNSLHGGGMDIFWNYTIKEMPFLGTANLKISWGCMPPDPLVE